MDIKYQASLNNANELEFSIFCIENLAVKLNRSPERVYTALTQQSDILYRYIIPEYEVLHTQSKEYILSDILDVMQEEGIII